MPSSVEVATFDKSVTGGPAADLKPALDKPASEAQRKMILGIGEKHCKLNAEQLDEKLVEKFAVTLAQLPMGMVNDALAFVRTLQPPA